MRLHPVSSLGYRLRTTYPCPTELEMLQAAMSVRVDRQSPFLLAFDGKTLNYREFDGKANLLRMPDLDLELEDS